MEWKKDAENSFSLDIDKPTIFFDNGWHCAMGGKIISPTPFETFRNAELFFRQILETAFRDLFKEKQVEIS